MAQSAATSSLPRGGGTRVPWSFGSSTSTTPTSSSSPGGTLSGSASRMMIRSERYRELKQLEQDARKSSKEMKALEVEIRDLSSTIEKLKKRDAQRLQKIGELDTQVQDEVKEKEKEQEEEEALSSENVVERVENGENGDMKKSESKKEELSFENEVERVGKNGENGENMQKSDSKKMREDLQSQLSTLRKDRTAAQIQLESAKETLERKQAELEKQSGEYQALIDLLAEEERVLQAAEMEESLQQSVAVQHEMRSLSEDLGRLGRLMEGLKESSSSAAEQMKQNSLVHQKQRVYHPVTSIRSKKLSRSLQNGSGNNALDLSRPRSISSSAHDPSLPPLRSKESSSSTSRSKEPAEFEEKEGGGNRKRQKSSTFEIELERLQHEQSEQLSLEQEAREKQMLLESLAQLSSSFPGGRISGSKGVSSRASPQQLIMSPSSVFEGFEVIPSLGQGPVRTGSTGSSSTSASASSESSSEFSIDQSLLSSSASGLKRLDLEIGGGKVTPQPEEDTTSSTTSDANFTESVFEYEEEISREGSREVQVVEVDESEEGSSWGKVVGEEVLSSENGSEEGIRRPPEEEAAEEPLEEEGEVIERPTEEEFGNFGDDAREEEEAMIATTTTGTKVEEDELEIPVERFEGLETTDETDITVVHILTTESSASEEVKRLAMKKIGSFGDGKTAEEVEAADTDPLTQQSASEADESVTGLRGPPEAEQVVTDETRAPVKADSNGHWNWRLEAENEMTQLGSQLSFLQKQVEDEVKLLEKTKKDLQLGYTSADTEQLSKQITFFADEVSGLRQNIDKIQKNLYKEGSGDRSMLVQEHWAKDLHSKCADQSAQLENLGKQVSQLAKELKYHLELRVDIEGKLDREAEERLKVAAQLTDLSNAFALTVSSMEKEEEAVGELVEQQKHLLVDQLKEAEKLRHIAELSVETLNKQIEHLELVCDVAQNLQAAAKYQDKALKYGLQALVQLFMLAIGVITLYNRVAEPLSGSLVPT